jgi:four helix bundle protein
LGERAAQSPKEDQVKSKERHRPLLPALGRFSLYSKSLRCAELLETVVVHGSLRDQLYRAMDSVVLNVAEGAAQRTVAAKNRHYAIARASAWEAAAALDLMRLRNNSIPHLPSIAGLLREMDAMLSALLKRR